MEWIFIAFFCVPDKEGERGERKSPRPSWKLSFVDNIQAEKNVNNKALPVRALF
jgi:hypothetical protein